MPIVDLAPNPLTAVTGRPEGFTVTPGKEDVDHGSDAVDTSLGHVVASAFRQGHTVISAISRQDLGTNAETDPDFNLWESIKGTKYEPHWSSFVDIRSAAAADARKRQLDMEEDDRRTLAGLPWYVRIPADLLSGAADPMVYLPGGAFYRGIKGGITVGKGIMAGAATAATGATAQELGLHPSQELRTGGESAMNIGTSVFLGGLLGAGGAKLLNRAEWNRSVAALNRDIGVATPPQPLHDIVLAHPDVADAVANPKVNRTQDVPYTAGPDKTGNGLNIDWHFPESFTVNADGSVVADAPETIVSAATIYRGKTYTGALHPDAVTKLADDLGVDVSTNEKFSEFYTKVYDELREGFITSKGEYVGRHKASEIAERAAQYKEARRGPPNLDSLEINMRSPGKTFDPAQPFAVHEFSERHAMEKLIAGGMDQETAYKVAHWEVAEKAEGAWYKENGIDQAKAEEAYRPFIDQIEHEKLARGEGDVPADLFRKPYPHDNVSAAAGEAAGVPKPTAAEAEEGRRILAQGEGQAAGAPASVGAAAHEPVSLEGNTIAGRAAGAVAVATGRAFPSLRLMQSPSAAVRDIFGKLSENSLYLKKNYEGVASDRAVETLMKEWNGGLAAAIDATKVAYEAYWKGAGGSKFLGVRTNRVGKLTPQEFSEAVGKAMRRNDEDPIPEVAMVAKAWRSKVFDPLKEAAIKAGLLPEDVSVDTAASYFSRMWNRNKLIAEEGRFKGIVSAYYKTKIENEYEKATIATKARLAKMDQEIQDLTLSPEGRAEQLGKVESQLAAHEEAGDAYLGLTDKADRLGEIAGEMLRAKNTRDTAAVEALRTEAKSIRKEGGKDLKDFMAERANLRTRRGNIDLGTAGLQERSRDIMEKLADLEEANQRSLQRLVKRGQVLERDLDKLDPETLAERISGMRDSFIAIAAKHDAAADRADQAIAKIKEDAAKRAEAADTAELKAELSPLQAQRSKGGQSLLPFIRKRGGIALDDPLAGDVRALGIGRILSKKGKPLDRVREAAVEAGYIRADDQGESTIRHLLDAMGEETRGNRVYIPGEEPYGLRPGEAPEEGAAPAARGPLGTSERGAQLLDAAEAKIIDRLEKHADAQRRRADKMETISTRLDIAEDFDREGAVAELRHSIDRSVAEVSNVSLARGERAQRMQERLTALDPQRVKDRVATVEQMKKDALRAYYDRWETKNLGQNVDLFALNQRPDFTDAANEIADTVHKTLTGRTEAGVRPEFMTVGTRGPMKDRTFNIPDHLIEDFLEHDVNLVGRRYTRVMGADVEMANKFGSVDMKDQLAAIRANYDRMRSAAPDEATRLKLGENENSDIIDLTTLRDLYRGTMAESPVERNYAKMARVVNHFNYIRQMGEAAFPGSLNDAVRPAMVHGLMPYMQTIGQLATNLRAIKASVGEGKLAGNITETILAHRMATITDIADPMSSRGPVEAFMENMSNVASKWNGIRLWTDMQKSITAVLTQNRILQGAELFSTTKDKPYLAMLGIDESMADRINTQFQMHGENIRGVRVANTEQWTDAIAVRAYRAAMNKDLDAIIVQAGKADVPLTLHTSPTVKMLLQFQTFNLASHQRVMMRGLQEAPSRFIGGTIAMTSMGMLITYLKALSGNRQEKQEAFTSNPGWWIGEGIDRAGIIPVPMELANRFEKMTGLNPIKSPLKAFDQGSAESQKNQNRGDFGGMLGPSVGLGEDIFNVARIPRTLYQGKDVAQAQKNAGERLVPFNSYFGVRQMFRYVVNPPH